MAGAVWLSDTVAFFQIGNSQIGVWVPFGQCLSGTTHVQTINVFVQGTSEVCCLYSVLPHPDEGDVVIQDCLSAVVPVIGEVSVVNSDPSCFCGGAIPVEATTWGAVKAQYMP
jgi:hypothetical protein